MSLEQNPFLILDVSYRDTKATIIEQYEDKVADADFSEQTLMLAQKQLLVSKERLNSELTWLPELNPKHSRQIASLVIDKDYSKLNEVAATIQGLAKANVAAYLCESTKSPKAVDELFLAQNQIDVLSILHDVNANRSLAGFPSITEEMANHAISSIRGAHSAVVIKCISSTEHVGNTFTKIVEKHLDDADVMSFVELVAEKYNTSVIGKLKSYEDEIEGVVKELKSGASSVSSISAVTSLLQDWDEYCQPLQLIYEAKGLDEPRSRELYHKMRDVCLWLANEKQEHELSLQFANTLFEVFPELPAVSTQIEDDIGSLKELIDGAVAEKDLSELSNKCVEIISNPKPFCTSVNYGAFKKNGKGLAGELYREFTMAVELSAGKDHAALPWLLVRKLSIHINNELSEHRVTQTIIKALQSTSPPPNIAAMLDDDSSTIEKNIVETEFQSALKSGNLNAALSAMDKLLALTPESGEERRDILAARQTLLDKRSEGWRNKIFGWGAVVVVIFLLSSC